MRIVLKNEMGSFEIGEGSRIGANLIEAEGFGVPSKEITSVVFEGQPGRTETASRDTERTITLSLDFYGGVKEIQKLYKIIYRPVDIICFLGEERRKTRGRCTNATDIQNIIYHRLQSAVLQFICGDPYFHDLKNIRVPIASTKDKLPNLSEGGVWYVNLPAIATERTNDTVITNRGDTRVYPVIYIENRKTENDSPQVYGITVTNETTGKTIKLEYNIRAGEIVAIDIPHRKITGSITGNITESISDDTVLGDFFIDTGQNKISVQSLNLNDDITAEIEYTNNYVTAVI